jgi:hypothetical protein
VNRALAIGLLLFGVSLGSFLHSLSTPCPPEPLPDVECPGPMPVVRVVRSEALSDEERVEADRILRLFWAQWGAERARHEVAQAMGGVDCVVYSPGYFEQKPYQPELGLWVRGYPSAAEAWIRKAIDPSDYRSENRFWAFVALQELAKVRHPGAEKLLMELCGAPDFRRWASEVFPGPFNDSAEESVARRILQESEGPWADERFAWALHVARERAVPWRELVLRERMGDRSPRVPMGDEPYDLCLLALAESGAPLSADERAYLKHYGYGCEPRARLAEVLKEKGY